MLLTNRGRLHLISTEFQRCRAVPIGTTMARHADGLGRPLPVPGTGGGPNGRTPDPAAAGILHP